MAASAGKKITRALVLVLLVTVGAVGMRAAYIKFYQKAYPVDYWTLVVREADRNNLPYDLVFAVIRTESSFRPHVESSVGARGLMQITEETFGWVKGKMKDAGDETYADLFDPEWNIRYGCKLLRLLLDEFPEEATALCAYHAGWGNAKKWLADANYSPDGITIDNIPFGDTKKYVAKIDATRAVYRELYDFVETSA